MMLTFLDSFQQHYLVINVADVSSAHRDLYYVTPLLVVLAQEWDPSSWRD